jgi:hypothetical protein
MDEYGGAPPCAAVRHVVILLHHRRAFHLTRAEQKFFSHCWNHL